MSEESQKEQITVRVIRNGAPEPPDNDWSKATPEERMEAVWTLTKLCMAWNQSSTSEPTFRELLLAFNAHDVEYLIVGAHALAAHGHVRATKDLDLWVRPEKSNAQKVLQALSDFGAPLSDLTVDDLSRKETIFQIGLPPLRIDVITDVDGVEFEEAWPDRLEASFGGVPAFVISRHHLITNKKTAARLQDLADVQQLEATGDGS
jgi:hypothetical protein